MSSPDQTPPRHPAGPPGAEGALRADGADLESTAALLTRIRAGDANARERLLGRYLPILKRWARGRLPASARDALDTDDLVQVTLIRTLNHLEEFEPRREGAFLAYLRHILLNSLRDQLRRVARRPGGEPLDEEVADSSPSVLEQAIGRDTLERYEAALAELPAEQQEAVILRVELDFTHQQIADALGKPSANAARMAVTRALVRLAEAMDARS
jgi:RNA polymerase sigma-70 factor (ECF subfamily)